MAEALRSGSDYNHNPDIEMTTYEEWDELADRVPGEDGQTPAERRQEIERIDGGEREASQEVAREDVEDRLGVAAVGSAYVQSEHNPFALGAKPESQAEQAEVEEEPVAEVEAASVYEMPKYNPFELGSSRAESREDGREAAMEASVQREVAKVAEILNGRDVETAIAEIGDAIAELEDEIGQMQERLPYASADMRAYDERQLAEANAELQSMRRKLEILQAVQNGNINDAKGALAVEVAVGDAPQNIEEPMETSVAIESEPAAMTHEKVLLATAEELSDLLGDKTLVSRAREALAAGKLVHVGDGFAVSEGGEPKPEDVVEVYGEGTSHFNGDFERGSVIDAKFNETVEPEPTEPPVEELPEPERKGIIAQIFEKIRHSAGFRKVTQKLKKAVMATVLTISLLNSAKTTINMTESKSDHDLMAAMNGPAIVTEIDQVAEAGDTQVEEAQVEEANYEGSNLEEQFQTIAESTIEKMPNGVPYNYDKYDDTSKIWVDEKGVEHRNDFVGDQSGTYGDREATINALMDTYRNEPEALVATASQIPSVLKAAGLEGKSPEEIDRMLDGENGGEIHAKLLSAMEAILNDPETETEFLKAEAQDVTTFYMKKLDPNKPSTPDNIELRKWDMHRDGELQVELKIPMKNNDGSVMTDANGNKLYEVVTINLRCHQPDVKKFTPVPTYDDDGDGSSTSEENPPTTIEEEDTPVEEEDTPEEDEDEEMPDDEEETPEDETPDKPESDQPTTEPEKPDKPEPEPDKPEPEKPTTTPPTPTDPTPSPDQPTTEPDKPEPEEPTTVPETPDEPTPTEDDVTPKDGNNLVENQSQETGDSEVDKPTEVEQVDATPDNVELNVPTEAEENKQDMAPDDTKTPEEQAQDIANQATADAAENEQGTTNSDLNDAIRDLL